MRESSRCRRPLDQADADPSFPKASTVIGGNIQTGIRTERWRDGHPQSPDPELQEKDLVVADDVAGHIVEFPVWDQHIDREAIVERTDAGQRVADVEGSRMWPDL